MADVHVLPNPKTLKVSGHKRRAPKPAASAKPVSRWPIWVAGGAVSVGGLLLVLSLQHLATGIVAITGCGWVEALLLAIGIDCGLIVAELAAIVAAPAVAKAIRLHIWSMIIATLVLSAGLNAWAFGQHSTGYMAYASYAFGMFIPAAVFALGKIAVALTGRH